jgi:E3 ubiquitin-protein ligase BIG BROTHER-like protein
MKGVIMEVGKQEAMCMMMRMILKIPIMTLMDDDDDDDDEEEDGEERYGVDVDDDEDAFDVHAHEEAGEDNNPIIEFDPAVFSSDEAYARALQDAEEREMAARLFALAGINDREFSGLL